MIIFYEVSGLLGFLSGLLKKVSGIFNFLSGLSEKLSGFYKTIFQIDKRGTQIEKRHRFFIY